MLGHFNCTSNLSCFSLKHISELLWSYLGHVTHLLSEECHVVVRLLCCGQVCQGGQQSSPDGPGALTVVLFLLHVVFGPVERKHAELCEDALQDGSLPGNGPQLLHLRHDSGIVPPQAGELFV